MLNSPGAAYPIGPECTAGHWKSMGADAARDANRPSSVELIELFGQQHQAARRAYFHIQITFLQELSRLLQSAHRRAAAEIDEAGLVPSADQVLQMRRSIHAGRLPGVRETEARSPARCGRSGGVWTWRLLLVRRARALLSVTGICRCKNVDGPPFDGPAWSDS